jgi:hypothetical protein
MTSWKTHNNIDFPKANNLEQIRRDKFCANLYMTHATHISIGIDLYFMFC